MNFAVHVYTTVNFRQNRTKFINYGFFLTQVKLTRHGTIYKVKEICKDQIIIFVYNDDLAEMKSTFEFLRNKCFRILIISTK